MKQALIIVQGLLMVFAAFFIVSLAYTIITSIFILLTGVQYINPQVDYCLMVLAVMISCLMFYFWYKKYMSHRVIKKIDLRNVFSIKKLIIYLMIGVGCQLFISGVLALLRPLFVTLFNYYDETISSIFVADTIIVAVYVIILAPIIEELMLRGIFFNRLRYGLPFMTANLLQAVVFGIYHWDIIQGLYAFGIGLLLGYMYEKTGTLLVPILVHMLINASGFLIQLLEIGKYIDIWMAIVVGGGLLFMAIYMFINSIRKEDDL